MTQTPEQQARVTIDKMLTDAGWLVQDRRELNLHAGRGVAVREFPLSTGPADYLLMVDHRPVGSGQIGPISRLVRDRYFDAVRGRLPEYSHWLTPIE